MTSGGEDFRHVQTWSFDDPITRVDIWWLFTIFLIFQRCGCECHVGNVFSPCCHCVYDCPNDGDGYLVPGGDPPYVCCECGFCGTEDNPSCCSCTTCFPSTGRVSLENGKSVAISELRNGDRVKTGIYIWNYLFKAKLAINVLSKIHSLRIPKVKTVKNPSFVVLHCTFTLYWPRVHSIS